MNQHDCTPCFKFKNLTSSWLAKNSYGNIKSIPSMKLVELRKFVNEEYNLLVILQKCARAKVIIGEKLFG